MMRSYVNFAAKYPDGDYRKIQFKPECEALWLYKPRKWVFDERANDYRLFVEGTEYYPWVDGEVPVLGKIIFENERYITVEIQPHEHTLKSNNFSKPYKHTIHKADLMNGRFKVIPIMN